MTTESPERTVYRQNARLRLRPFEPWHAVMAYTPDKPALHWLNSHSWLVLELCDGRTLTEIAGTIAEIMPDRDDVLASTKGCIEDLERKSLVHASTDAGEPPAGKEVKNR
ncbi:PqqD family peptide modification chaperone [Streptomyces sp. SID486]|uniref:PqqD family protein n=1 Tax=Streptomyces rameus TaxID=68261 RepID=A0ABN3UYG6_9ACTN|nr:PqqD family peptide modification chaperone [Streptomyces sp. SID486]